jgi:hypothetical protein
MLLLTPGTYFLLSLVVKEEQGGKEKRNRKASQSLFFSFTRENKNFFRRLLAEW